MITCDFDRRGRQSKYEYLHRCIRSDIREGKLADGTKLPSKRTLAKQLGVSVSTVEQAYDLLVSEACIEPRPGSGFYVRSHGGPYGNSTDGQDEDDCFIDFRANVCSERLFPIDTWARLARKVLAERDSDLFRTAPYNGLPRLRKAIAEYLYDVKGMRVSPDCVVVGAGTEYLYGRLLRLFGRHCEIAIGEFGSKNLFNVAQPLDPVWDCHRIDADGMVLGDLEKSPVRLVHVSPANHFPAGAVMSRERREQLLEWAHRSLHRYIIEDDYDSELVYGGRSLPPLFSQDDAGRVIYLNTFSKTLMPSLRISYMVLPRPLMALYIEQMSFYSCTVSSLEQLVLAAFIEGGHFERHINRLRRFYDKQRLEIKRAFESSPLQRICRLSDTDVGTHMILYVNTDRSDSEIVRAALDRGIHLTMLTDYCVNVDIYDTKQIVINIAAVEYKQIPKMTEMLEEILFER